MGGQRTNCANRLVALVAIISHFDLSILKHPLLLATELMTLFLYDKKRLSDEKKKKHGRELTT